MLKTNQDQTRNDKMTIADLCQAISDGTLPASVHDGEWYVVRERDLRRLCAYRGMRTAGQGCAA